MRELEEKLSMPDWQQDDLVLLRCLGSGSVASVWACRFKGKQGSYAVKIVKLDKSNDSQKKVDIYLTEVKILQNTRHKNLLEYLGFKIFNDELYLFMELYDTNLAALLANKRNNRYKTRWYSPTDIKKFCLHILRGLNHLHTHSIAHRDLKVTTFMSIEYGLTPYQPENILARLKILNTVKSLHISDFGTSKQISAHGTVSSVVGTPGFMAPEVTKHTQYNPFKADGTF